MKQLEKNIQSQERILNAALTEFGLHSYDHTSINSICKNHKLSKGLIYHYFKSKDELFLLCVQETFTALSTHLETACTSIEAYFKARETFFDRHPEYAAMFSHAMFNPPSHLTEDIHTLHQNLQAVNQTFIKNVLSKLTLRENISLDEATNYFLTFEKFFNIYSKLYTLNYTESSEKIKAHDHSIYTLLDRMLYGIAKQEA